MYVCKRCNYETLVKCNYSKHLNRKRICKVIKEDVSIEQLKKELHHKIPQNTTKSPHFSTFHHKNTKKKWKDCCGKLSFFRR